MGDLQLGARGAVWDLNLGVGRDSGMRDAGRLQNWSKFVLPLSFTLVLNTFDVPTAMIAFPTKDISGEGDTTGS